MHLVTPSVPHAGRLPPAADEAKRRLRAERRLRLLHELAEEWADSRGVEAVFAGLDRRLKAQEDSLPFGLVYLFEEGSARARLAWTRGVPAGSDLAPLQIEPGAADCLWPAARLWSCPERIVIEHRESHQIAVCGKAARALLCQAVMIPLKQPGQSAPAGFLAMELNPGDSGDAEFLSFADLLAGQLAAALFRVQVQAVGQTAEAQANFLRELTRQLAMLQEAVEIIRVGTSAIGRQLGVQRCFFLETSSRSDRAIIHDNWLRDGAASLVGEYRPEEYGRAAWQEALTAGTVAVEEVGRHPLTQAYAARYAALQIGACVLARCSHPGSRAVCLVVTEDRQRTWRKSELDLLEQGLNRIWPLVERARALSALRSSEERFRIFTNHAPVGIWVANLKGEFVFVNQCWCAMAGFTLVEAHGQGWLQAVHPEDRERVRAEWIGAVNAGIPLEIEFRFQRPDGIATWVQGRTALLQNVGGKITGYIGTVADMTERKGAEEALKSKEKQLRLITASAPVMLMQCDAEERFVFANRTYLERRGYALEMLVGKTVREVVGDEYYFRLQPHIRRVLAGAPAEFEVELPLAGLGRRQFAVSLVPERDQNEKVCGWVAALTDITDRKRADDATRHFAAIVESSEDAIISKNLEGIVTSWNPGAERLFGYTAEEMVGWSITRLIPPERLGEEAYILARIRRGEAVSHYETTRRRKDGTQVNISLTISPIRDGQGRILGASKIARDITDRKRHELELRRQEQLYRGVGEAINYGVWVADAEGRNRYLSDSFLKLVGLTQQQCLGFGWMSALHPDEIGPTLASWKDCVRTGDIWERECTCYGVDGRWHPILVRGRPIRDEDGKIISWVGINLDIVTIKKTQETVQQRTRMLEAVNRVSIKLVAELDLGKIIQSVTDAGCEISGATFGAFFYKTTDESGPKYKLYTLSGASRSPFEGLETPPSPAIFKGEMRITRCGDLTKIQSREQIPPRTNLLVRSYMAVPVVSRSGEVIGGLFFGHPEPDVFTEESEKILTTVAAQAAIAIDNAKLYQALARELNDKRQAEAKLQTAQIELQAYAQNLEQKVEERTASLREAIAQMEEFSYTVSHDLRAPLRAMYGYAQVLQEDYAMQLDATARGYLTRIQRNSVRMEKLTHDLLAYSRVARSELTLDRINLGNLLDDLIAQYQELQAPLADLQIVMPIAEVRAHETSLSQCLANLLTNSVKFVPDGVRPRVTVRTEHCEGWVRIWVEDNGIGIDPQYRDRIFQIFERVPHRETYEGTGIGLAIVRKAMEKMGGRYGVESTEGAGARFWLELPGA